MNVNIFTIIVSSLVVFAGWIVVHNFNVRRDTLAKRRDLRVQYLVDAYRNLESSSNRKNSLPEVKKAFESAVSDIQLFGTPEQIETLLKYLRQFKDGHIGDLVPVLNLLREDLRKELELSNKVERIHQYRFHD